MKTSDFKLGQTVTLATNHTGIVSSVNKRFVFVKYYPQLDLLGWDGAASQACDPEELTHREVKHRDKCFIKRAVAAE